MSMFRHSSVLKKLLFKNSKCLAISNVPLQSTRYSTEPPDYETYRNGEKILGHTKAWKDANTPPSYYDLTHLEGEEQVGLLDTSEPLTPEMRAKLAAKYNLRPEDYVPLSYNNGLYTLGDYPLLPTENALERDPHYDWDDPFFRRNWGEPIFHEQEAYTPCIGVDSRPYPWEVSQMWKPLVAFVAGYFFLFWLGQGTFFFPEAPKQYPEYYAHDDRRTTGHFDYVENRGKENMRYKERKTVVNYTFPKKNDFSGH